MNPKYSVVQTPKFERNFRKLRSELQRRISEQILATKHAHLQASLGKQPRLLILLDVNVEAPA